MWELMTGGNWCFPSQQALSILDLHSGVIPSEISHLHSGSVIMLVFFRKPLFLKVHGFSIPITYINLYFIVETLVFCFLKSPHAVFQIFLLFAWVALQMYQLWLLNWFFAFWSKVDLWNYLHCFFFLKEASLMKEELYPRCVVIRKSIYKTSKLILV